MAQQATLHLTIPHPDKYGTQKPVNKSIRDIDMNIEHGTLTRNCPSYFRRPSNTRMHLIARPNQIAARYWKPCSCSNVRERSCRRPQSSNHSETDQERRTHTPRMDTSEYLGLSSQASAPVSSQLSEHHDIIPRYIHKPQLGVPEYELDVGGKADGYHKYICQQFDTRLAGSSRLPFRLLDGQAQRSSTSSTLA
jgi:hypothetical protein